jgi:hypothetical protein
MNSERRHELQQNALADMLGTQIRRIEPYNKLIAVGIALLIVAAVSIGLYRSAAVGTRSDATFELLQNSGSGDPEALGVVGERYSDTTAGALAKLLQADALLAAGINGLFNDREETLNQLGDAVKRYSEVAGSTKDTLIRSRANFGLARAQESLGDVEKAIAAYNTVVSIGESEAITKVAQQRIDMLKGPLSQEFFAWFEKQDFKPADPSLPPALPSGVSLPDLPDLSLPEVSPLNVPAELKGEAAEGDAPGEIGLPEDDATSAESAAGETPAEETVEATQADGAAADDAAPATAEEPQTEPTDDTTETTVGSGTAE